MDKTSPFLSVITVCYNAGATIARTLKSLQNQTNQDFELIIIDGKSQDATLPIINSFGELASKVVSEPDNGIYDAMNKGISLAKGRYLSFLNADDAYMPTTVEKLHLAFLHKQADVYYGDIEKVRDFNGRFYRKIAKPNLELMPKTMGIFHPATFAKKDLFLKYGSFDTTYKLAADYHWVLKIYLQKATFTYLPEVMARFYIGGRSNFSCESYREAALIQQQFQTGYHIEMEKLYAKCLRKSRKQRLINKFVSLWPVSLIYRAYLKRKWQ